MSFVVWHNLTLWLNCRMFISSNFLLFTASVRCPLKASKSNVGRSCHSPRCLIQTLVNRSIIRPPESILPLFKFHDDPRWYLSFDIVFLLKILHGGSFFPICQNTKHHSHQRFLISSCSQDDRFVNLFVHCHIQRHFIKYWSLVSITHQMQPYNVALKEK